eukprot:scaffold938_cov334-Pavlova_lutheri.AAC.78
MAGILTPFLPPKTRATRGRWVRGLTSEVNTGSLGGTQEVNRDVNIGVVETECGQGRGVSSEGAWTSSMGGSR